MLFGASIVLLCFSNWNKETGEVSIVCFINKTDVAGIVPAQFYTHLMTVLKAIIKKKSAQCSVFGIFILF